jgi:gliding motility-associated-like protein
MRIRLYLAVLAVALTICSRGQGIVRGEYFFDTDPGPGNGTTLSFTPSAGDVTFTSSISIASLSNGFHLLGLRVKESGGSWSLFEGRGFYISTVTADAGNLVAAEYFFDADPGVGNGTPLSIPSGATSTFTTAIPVGSLPSGFHFLAIRTQDVSGKWGLFEGRGFYITGGTTDVPNLVAAEYFFDTDPGQGNGTSIPVSAGANVNFTVSLPTGSLAPGFHFLAIRTKGADGKWGLFEGRGFYITSATTDVPNIVEAEFFFDSDPGAGNGQPITPITSGSTVNFNVSLPSSLSPGFHFLAIRTKRADGQWGLFESRGFYVSPTQTASADIVAAEYYFDGEDPGEGNGTPLTLTAPGPSINETFIATAASLPSGDHTLSLRVKDAAGIWSTIETGSFVILSCTPPAPPVAPDVTRCDPGTVILSATGATGSQVYRWYDDPGLNDIISTGPTYTTPSLSAPVEYYVSIYDPITTCESAGTAVTANVVVLTAPVINPTGTLSFCEGITTLLSAPSGFTQYVWSSGETTAQILVTAAGDYSVQVGDGTCLSAPSAPTTVDLIPAPTKPVITVNGNTTICGTGSVDLSGPAGFLYTWSTGETTQTITVSLAGVYYLSVRTSSGNCPSLPSDPVVVNVLTPPCGGGGTNEPPVIANNPLATPIEGTVTLDLTTIITDPDSNVDFTTLTLTSNSTSRGAPALIDGSYNLVIDYSGLPFTGTDRVTVEVCDLAGACVQQVLDIEVVGAVVVYNGVTPDGDNRNDFLLLKYIDVIEGGMPNKVTIFNRWGAPVFEMSDYNNQDRVFTGTTTSGSDLPSGTYFYRIEFTDPLPPLTGFLTLLR